MDLVCSRYKDCKNCDLYKNRQNIVFGSGNPDASILIVKEMPTDIDDKFGTFFTTSLDFLVELFHQVVLSKRGRFTTKEAREVFSEEVFVTSAVPCRGVVTSGDNMGNTREPKQSELKACRDRLYETIYAVDPDIVLACGKSAVMSLTKRNKDLPQKVGTLETMFHFEIPGVLSPTVKYSAIYTHDLTQAERIGDYDDPHGVISQLTVAVDNVWKISSTLKGEKL